MVLLLIAVATMSQPAFATAAPQSRNTAGRATVVSEIAQARSLLIRVPSSRFLHGHRARAALVRQAARASHLTRRGRSCPALVAVDGLSNALHTPKTWKHKRIPRSLIRRPVNLLAAAGRLLLPRAGPKCARPSKAHRLKGHRGRGGGAKVQPPDEDPEQGEGVDKKMPPGPFRPPKSIGGGTGLGVGALASGAHAAAGRPRALALDPVAWASGEPLAFFRNADVGVPPLEASPQEVTAAIGENVVWFTGNSSVALSTDAGRTFRQFDPSEVLPDEGLAFCCDQLVSYSPSYHMFVWVMQYWCNKPCLTENSEHKNVCRSDGVFNRIRIAVASPADLRAHASNPGAAWTYWDVTPGTIGQPGNAWFDRSDLSVNPSNMNWSVDVLCGSGSSLLGRISLEQLSHRGTVNLGYIVDSPQRMQTAQGEGTTTTYFTGSNSDSQARIWSWARFSGTLFRHDINHSSVPYFDNEIKGTDGSNWYDRYGIFPGAVESSTSSGSTLYLAQGTGRAYCTANCKTEHPTLKHVFDQPAIFITKFDVNTWHETGERWLWNPTYAVGWPALSTDRAGDVGIDFRASPNNANAQPVAGFLTPDEEFVLALPAGLPHETGDYYTLRPGRTSQSFVMPAQTVQYYAGVPTMHWNFIEYGHGPAPYVAPPNDSITTPVDFAHFTLGQDITYTAQVSDPIDGTLPSHAIVWREDGNEIGRGPLIVRHGTPVGLHTITVTATNGDGKSASATISVRVLAPPGDVTASINSPPDGSEIAACLTDPKHDNEYYADVHFLASASDSHGLPLTYRWTDSVDGKPAQLLSEELSPTLRLYTESVGFSTHNLTLTASNGTSTGIAEVTLKTSFNGCIH